VALARQALVEYPLFKHTCRHEVGVGRGVGAGAVYEAVCQLVKILEISTVLNVPGVKFHVTLDKTSLEFGSFVPPEVTILPLEDL
jgi:hypothetical protein